MPKTPLGQLSRMRSARCIATEAKAQTPIYTSLSAAQLLNSPLLNKGAAFSLEERHEFGLQALLPYEVHTLDLQMERAYQQLQALDSDILRYEFLLSLKEQNLVLYFALLHKHLKELVPM
jgi:malate dehydrogenase (oxaloacetate-decarboxylating)